MTDGLLDQAVDKVADRAPVDWDAIERDANSDDDRKWLECLRVLAEISGIHQTIDRDEDVSLGTSAETVELPVWRRAESTAWGRYRLLAKVGEGGFGRVHRAWDPQLEREIAIKILHPRIGDERLKDTLLREGRALAKVRHPNVVSVLGVEFHDDRVGLCMEFVHGETLEDIVRRQGPMVEREAALVCADVCRALAAVHAAGFVHRDVKARNVMRDHDGRVVLMDFGAGQQADQLRIPGRTSMVGTPLYMAPEVLAGGVATIGSDVYSVGVLIYRLVTGAYPVEGATIEEIRSAHMQGRRTGIRERRAGLHGGFVKVVDRALAADPSKRFADATALLEALEGVSRGLSPVAKGAVTVAGVGLAGAVVILSGVAATIAFDRTLGRTVPFNSDSWYVTFDVGWRSIFPPVLYITLMWLLLWMGGFLGRVLRLVPWCDRAARAVARSSSAIAARLELNDPMIFASAVLTIASIGIAAIVWRFSGLLDALTVATISDQPAERLMPLRPGHPGYLYRLYLEGLMLVIGLAMVRLRRLRGDRTAKRRGIALLSVPLVIVVLMAQLPYRLLWHSLAPRVVMNGERCYVLGESADQALVFCPDRTPPRNRVVDVNEAGFRRLGIVENIFTAPETAR